MKQTYIKIIAVLLVILVSANLFLMVLGRINPAVFWVVMIAVALIAYKGLPCLRKI